MIATIDGNERHVTYSGQRFGSSQGLLNLEFGSSESLLKQRILILDLIRSDKRVRMEESSLTETDIFKINFIRLKAKQFQA